MQTHRLKAPAADGALLAEPPLGRLAGAIEGNAGRLDRWDYDFQGRRADRLRPMARSEVLALARRHHERYGLDVPALPGPAGRLVVTGHQPELFHPGVWAKNFAAAGIAAAHTGGAVGLNLIVDNDIPKGPGVRIPRRDGTGLKATSVDFDLAAGDIPYEDQAVRDEWLFSGFGDRALATLGGLVPDPLIRSFWPRVLGRTGATNRFGLRFALARREVEAEWGARNLEVPIGEVCETEAFAWFACHLLADLPRFQAVHNDALRRYRDAYGIRSKHHPVPALAAQGDWLEAPFWAWRVDSPRRRPLLARQLARTMELRIGGEDEPFAELPLSADRDACCAVDDLRALAGRGIRFRTRALTTTMFARYLLGDVFVHGIGGAKYDELGDEVARGYFGIEPPTFLTLSLTQHIGIGGEPASRPRLADVHARLRDLRYNPDRHLGGSIPPEALAAIESKRAEIARVATARGDRMVRLRAIKRINEGLYPLVADQVVRLDAERRAIGAGLRRDAVARSREYAFPIHGEGRLREAMAGVMASAGAG